MTSTARTVTGYITLWPGFVPGKDIWILLCHSSRQLSGMALDDRGFGSRQGLWIFLFSTASRRALKPSQPPIQWVLGALSLGVKRPGLEADHSPPSSAEVDEYVELYLHSPITPSWRGAQLKHRNNFNFYLSVFQISSGAHPYSYPRVHIRGYPKVSGLAAWSENCKWYRSLLLGAVVSLFCESV
jgi:hypothetical protein